MLSLLLIMNSLSYSSISKNIPLTVRTSFKVVCSVLGLVRTFDFSRDGVLVKKFVSPSREKGSLSLDNSNLL